ncbi:hypothetical protein D3C81_2169330 [compost metagenome]
MVLRLRTWSVSEVTSNRFSLKVFCMATAFSAALACNRFSTLWVSMRLLAWPTIWLFCWVW